MDERQLLVVQSLTPQDAWVSSPCAARAQAAPTPLLHDLSSPHTDRTEHVLSRNPQDHLQINAANH